MIKAIYGKVILNRHLCPNCNNWTLNSTKAFKCDVCGFVSSAETPKGIKVIVPPPGIRKVPPREIQRQLLEVQANKCYWCSNKFGSYYYAHVELKQLKVHYDHKIPFSYEQTDRAENWVASCDACNRFKGDLMFGDDRECREYLRGKWLEYIHKEKIELVREGKK
jgi:hypothetical protein